MASKSIKSPEESVKSLTCKLYNVTQELARVRTDFDGLFVEYGKLVDITNNVEKVLNDLLMHDSIAVSEMAKYMLVRCFNYSKFKFYVKENCKNS